MYLKKMATTTKNPLFSKYEETLEKVNGYSIGENGMLQLNENGLTSSNDKIDIAKARLTALSVSLVRGNSTGNPKRGKRGIKKSNVPTKTEVGGIKRTAILKLFRKAMDACLEIPDDIDRANYIQHLVVLAFNLRDIRGTYGKGERTLSYWLFIELWKEFPETMEVLVHEVPNYGSWLDLNKLYELIYSDRAFEPLMNEILEAYVSQIAIDKMAMESRKKGLQSSDKQTEISLAARWVPKEGRSTDRFTKITKALARKAYPKEWDENYQHALNLWRRTVTALNREINTTEQLMCAKEFSKIKFKLVSGRCLNKFTNAWLDIDRSQNRQHPNSSDRNACRKNYKDFLNQIQEGKANAKGKSMFVHEIAREVINSSWPMEENRRILLENQFNDHVRAIEKHRDENGLVGLGDMLPLVDTSGSMEGDPLYCAVAVGVIASSLNSPVWRDYVLTFTTTPTLVRLRYPRTKKEYDLSKGGYSQYTYYYSKSDSVYSILGEFDQREANRELTWLEKIQICSRIDWGGSTNFLKAIDCVTVLAQESGVQLPNRILTITDMQWDQANSTKDVSWSADTLIGKVFNRDNTPDSWNISNSWDTGVEMIENMLQNTRLGDGTPLKMPQMIFWNARGGHGGYAVQADKKNTVMVSGFSSSMLKVFLMDNKLESEKESNTCSWSTLENVLLSGDYTRIRMLTGMIGEDSFRCVQEIYLNSVTMPPTYKANHILSKTSDKPVQESRENGNSDSEDTCPDSDTDSCSNMPSIVEREESVGSVWEANKRMDVIEEKVDGIQTALSGIQDMLKNVLNKTGQR